MADKIIIGKNIPLYCPIDADFKRFIPTPSGRISEKILSAFGKISAGIVAPEKKSIGK